MAGGAFLGWFGHQLSAAPHWHGPPPLAPDPLPVRVEVSCAPCPAAAACPQAPEGAFSALILALTGICCFLTGLCVASSCGGVLAAVWSFGRSEPAVPALLQEPSSGRKRLALYRAP